MKKLISAFAIICVAASMLFADLDSDRRRVLSFFKDYQLYSSESSLTYESWKYYVHDYSGRKFELWFSRDKFDLSGRTNYINLRLDGSPIIHVECKGSENRWPVVEFMRECSGDRIHP